MSILNTLRQSGGADIKLKNKYKSIGKLAAVLIVLGLLCRGLYALVDTVFNGLVLDWIYNNFIYTYEQEDENGVQMLITDINWPTVKIGIFFLFCFFVFVMFFLVYGSAKVYARKQVKLSVKKTCSMIRVYRNNSGGDVEDIFPEEYSELASQMVQWKSQIERNENLLKEEAERKSDLIAYLAHDLKTPLTSVVGYLSLLHEASDMPDKQREKYVGIALDKACRLENLINEFFDITRYNLQQIILEKEKIDLYYMLVQLTDEFYPLLTAHGNTIELHSSESLTVYGDADKLARVFNNILKNAIAYSYPDTVISVQSERKDGFVRISFANQGKTIPKVKLEQIFEKFFRLDQARSTDTGGSGLGLAIAREIVDKHGGKLYAESEKECTTFHVELPEEAED